MKFMNRKMLVVGALAAFAGSALVGPSIASAKTYKVSFKVTKADKQVGTKIGATYSGKPFGTCKMTGTLVIPKTKQTVKCKGGTFKLTATGDVGTIVKGTWKFAGGTGKYKGIKGGGKFQGPLATSKFVYTGTAKY